MNALQTLKDRWQQMARREQRLVLAALVLVGVAVVWLVAVAPALTLLKKAPQQHQELDAQLAQMQVMQVKVQALRAQPVVTASSARSALEAATTSLGSNAQMAVQTDRVTVTFKGVAPAVLAQWLATVRQNARMVPNEAHWTRSESGGWDGRLVLQLPAK
jgi:general secretion pathway protein M